MKKSVYLLLLFVAISVNRAQDVDSLVNMLNTQKHTPDEQLGLYLDICRIYMYADTKKNMEYAEKGLALAGKENNLAMAAKFTELMGVTYSIRESYDTAFAYFEKALGMALESRDKVQEASTYISWGVMCGRQGKRDMALEYYMKALPLVENDPRGSYQYAAVLGNIGMIHLGLGNTERAIHYFELLKEKSERENDYFGIRNAYESLGPIYRTQGKLEKALEYARKVVDISRKSGEMRSEINGMMNLARIHMEEYKDYEKALEYARACLPLAQKYDDSRYISGVWELLSDIYLGQKQYRDSEDAATLAWAADSLNSGIALNLALSNIHLGNSDKAETFLWKYIDLVNERNKKSLQETLAEMDVKYETGNREMRIVSLEKEIVQYIWLGLAGAAILLPLIILLFVRHRLTVQKRKIAEQQVKQLEQEKQLIAAQAILDGETAERVRLARDLHDGLGGMLSVIKLNLKDMKGYSILDNSDVNRYHKALDMLDQSIGELRRVAHHIMPESLMRYGLQTSLEDFCRAIPGANFRYFGEKTRLDNSLEVLVYRCAYELINNAVKHAKSTVINVQLMIDAGLVSLTVQDNGVGFDPASITPGAGLENIRTRISACNGKMHAWSEPGKGTEVSIEIEKTEN
ncbi:MAG: tetratricopeptide repeat protein [Bacteroidales bacterium]|jgi:signal transduction histidine kinase/Tfp pilus assembly protein PilF|nr:tetratricopeptide repeat protein [Bacteroidales bacterium]